VPFIRYARDKRGYESTFVMLAYRGTNGAPRTRVLYVFRSPSNLKVGRRAIEPEVREALEHTHPDLSFDWDGLLHEPAMPRFESRERPQRSERHDRSRGRPAPEPPVAPVIEDESLLGRTLGAREAARLRRRYSDLLQRIARRARTPEDRDRLTERLARLNPDEWPDETTVRAAAASVETEWDGLDAELPQRRRGRRGGRFREGQNGPADAQQGAPAAADASGIISGEGNPHDNASDELDTSVVGQSGDRSGDDDGGRLGADTAPDVPDAEAGPDATNTPIDPGVQSRDGHHFD
jgi:hypothetical protein